uniref:Ig-like domain-containing protein n=1 Tax=Pygocentrus nattereri TaxID=42514 RepID=A0AAR2LC17_PYGNA
MLCNNLNSFYAAETVDIYQKQSYVSAKPGEAVTLQCTLADHQSTEDVFWYKQPVGQMPQEVDIKGAFMEAVFSSHFKNSSFKLERVENSVSLTIPHPTKDDEAMYYCGISVMKMIKFSTGTFLAITDHPHLNISVLQTPVQGSVSPGESVTLQCTVLSEIRAADLRVIWFRAAAGQSFPEIIYTHQNSSSHQYEISSSTSCSLYEFSKNILDQHYTGTYYCTVAACGKIIWGSGSTVETGRSLLVMGLALGLFAVWNVTLCCFCMTWKICKHCRGDLIEESTYFVFSLFFSVTLIFCFSVHFKAVNLTLTHTISQDQASYKSRYAIIVLLGSHTKHLF